MGKRRTSPRVFLAAMALTATLVTVSSCTTTGPGATGLPDEIAVVSPHTSGLSAGRVIGISNFLGYVFFPDHDNVQTVQVCSVLGGPVTVTLDSYDDPFGADTDIRASGHSFAFVGETIELDTLGAAQCMLVYLAAPTVQRQIPSTIENGCLGQVGICYELVWPGFSVTIDF